MQYSTDRILTTHAGSLPRPQSLADLHTAKFAGTTIDEAVLEQAVEDATRMVIEKQIEAGVDILNNGEMGRESFSTYWTLAKITYGCSLDKVITTDV